MSAASFGYDGKRVLVIGGATGMGASAAKLAAELGGQISVLDVVDIDFDTNQSLHVDLSDKVSVDRALSQLDGHFDAVFSCAGIADGPDLMRVNFISQRYMIDTMVADGRLGEGTAVAMISSIGGYGWQSHVDEMLDFLASDTWEAMEQWIEAHEGSNNYVFSKQAMNTYVARQAFDYARKRMRINALMPGGTDTPLARKNPDTWLPFQADFREATARSHLTPEQMGNAVAFLCMDAASGINGATLVVDDGYVPSTITHAFDSPIVAGIIAS